jgi:hypothetical protein
LFSAFHFSVARFWVEKWKKCFRHRKKLLIQTVTEKAGARAFYLAQSKNTASKFFLILLLQNLVKQIFCCLFLISIVTLLPESILQILQISQAMH